MPTLISRALEPAAVAVAVAAAPDRSPSLRSPIRPGTSEWQAEVAAAERAEAAVAAAPDG